jgi:hypothetical protein
MAKPLKQSKKFSLQSSGLSLTEKASSANVKISWGRTSSTSVGGGGVCWAPVQALDLFDLGSSASDGEAATDKPRRKCPRKSLPPKVVPKPSDAPAAKGTSARSFTFHLS